MRTKIFLLTLLLVIPSVAGAQNASAQEDSGILSFLPDVQIDSVDKYNNQTVESTDSQSTLSWIIILILIFLGIVLYSFDIDPKWVVLLIGAAALVFFLTRLGLLPI